MVLVDGPVRGHQAEQIEKLRPRKALDETQPAPLAHRYALDHGGKIRRTDPEIVPDPPQFGRRHAPLVPRIRPPRVVKVHRLRSRSQRPILRQQAALDTHVTQLNAPAHYTQRIES